MIYLVGNSFLEKALNSYHLTKVLTRDVNLVVIELPANIEVLNNIPLDIPVIGVIENDVLNLKQVRMLNQRGVEIVGTNELAEKVGLYVRKKQENIIAFKELSTEKPVIKNELKTFLQSNTAVQDNPKTNQQTHSQFDSPNKITSMLQFEKNSKCYIATSFSTAGGVGKTFLCIGLAACAALGDIKTVAVDLDLRSSELDFAIGLTDPIERNKIIDKKAVVPKGEWVTLDNWRNYQDSDDISKHILKHNSGLYVIPCYPSLNTTISEIEITNLIYKLSQSFNFIILDGGVDFMQSHIKSALEISNHIYLIGDQEIKTIGKVSGFLTHVSPNIKNKSKLIINMATPLGYYAPDEVAEKLGFLNSYDEIPDDKPGVSAAKRSCRTIAQTKGSSAGESIWQIAQKHLPFHIGSKADTKPKKV